MNTSKWLADRQLNFLVAVNLLVVIVATALSHGQFVDIDNLQSMGSQLPELGLLALGIMLSMVSGNGGIDLSGVALANLSGMVAAQLGCSMEEALGRLRVRADATGQALDELALDVLDGIVRFEP